MTEECRECCVKHLTYAVVLCSEIPNHLDHLVLLIGQLVALEGHGVTDVRLNRQRLTEIVTDEILDMEKLLLCLSDVEAQCKALCIGRMNLPNY